MCKLAISLVTLSAVGLSLISTDVSAATVIKKKSDATMSQLAPGSDVMLNPQPLPPGKRYIMGTVTSPDPTGC